MNCGVYTITAPSGKQYVGSTVNFTKRWREHISQLRRGRHHSIALQRAWAKYGEAIVFKTLLICSPENLLFYEQRAIDCLSPKYNRCPKAGSRLGVRHTVESKNKLSAAHRGKHHSREWVERQAAAIRGKKRSPAQIENLKSAFKNRSGHACSPLHKGKISAALKGRHLTLETRAKIGAAKRGKSNAFWQGRKHSEETKAKMRAAAKARNPSSAEHLSKMLAASNAVLKGKKLSAEHRMKISVALSGKAD